MGETANRMMEDRTGGKEKEVEQRIGKLLRDCYHFIMGLFIRETREVS